MFFTIAIPTYNNALTIEKAILSALNQDFEKPYEVLVLNNNSTDGTKVILEKNEHNVKVITNETTVSMYENHNLCLTYAKGDYIIFCHADDELLSNALNELFIQIKKRCFPDKYVLWGRSKFRDFYAYWKDGGGFLNKSLDGEIAINAFLSSGLTPSGTCYARKSFNDTNGFINIKHRLAPSDSVTMWKLALRGFKFEMIDQMYFIRERATTASGSSFNFENQFQAMYEAVNNLFNELTDLEIAKIVKIASNARTVNLNLILIFKRLQLLSNSQTNKITVNYILKNIHKLRKRRIRELCVKLLVK